MSLQGLAIFKPTLFATYGAGRWMLNNVKQTAGTKSMKGTVVPCGQLLEAVDKVDLRSFRSE